MAEPTYPRFKVHAYVDADGVIHAPRLDAWALWGDIWMRGPVEVAFAVVEAADGEFLAWRFMRAPALSEALARNPPEPWARGSSVDALVMKAVHHVR